MNNPVFLHHPEPAQIGREFVLEELWGRAEVKDGGAEGIRKGIEIKY